MNFISKKDKEIIGRLLKDGQQQFIEDLNSIGQIVSSQPPVSLTDDASSRIKAHVLRSACCLRQRRKVKLRRLAAALILVSFGLALFFAVQSRNLPRPGAQQELIAAELWDSPRITEADPDIALLYEKADQLGSELISLRASDSAAGPNLKLDYFEIELEEIKSDFWKG